MNPWLTLPTEPPYVLKDDQAKVEAYNKVASGRHAIDTSLIPEPFLGRPGAPILVLGLNPGWSPGDAECHANADFSRLCRENLIHAGGAYPFYLLNPALDAPGSRWWRSRLRSVIDAVGLESVARGFLCVEYFPYHSDSYGHRTPRVQSQDYGFELVQAGMARGAIIVVLRSFKLWTAALPGLARYNRHYRLRSVQYVSISPKNCPDGYKDIVQTLRNEHAG